MAPGFVGMTEETTNHTIIVASGDFKQMGSWGHYIRNIGASQLGN